jgi:hypothetical protein
LQKLTLSPGSVPGGAPATAIVTLSCDVPQAVTVSLNGASGASVPSALHVAKGRDAASATVGTSTTTKTKHDTISATFGKVRKTATLTLTPTPKTCKSPALASVSLASLVYVGNHPALTMKLNCAAASTVKLTLNSTNSYLPVSATVLIGKYYSAATVALTPKAYEIGGYTATVDVRLGSKTVSRSIQVDPGLTPVQIPPASNSPDDVTLDVLFTGELPAGGVTVQLKSSNAAVKVPATSSFPAPSFGGEVVGITVSPVTKDTKVTLSAVYEGSTFSASVTLVPDWTSGDKITIAAAAPGPLYGPSLGNEYYVNLSNPAAADGNGLNITVTTSDPGDLQLDSSSVLVSDGENQGIISPSVPYVTSAVHATITATLDGATASIPVTFEPSLDSFTLPASIVGGESGTGTITLAGPVDTATTVDLQSTWGILDVPFSVTIPKGASSAQFQITTVAVTSDSEVSIVASLGSTTLQSGNIDVTPAS